MNHDCKTSSQVMVHQLLLLVIVFSLSRSDSLPCSGPVTFSSPDFTITGPCPDSEVIAPVGSTVQYRCDYEDIKSVFYRPYWHIAELSGTPFVLGWGTNYSFGIAGSTSTSDNSVTTGNTIITIPLQEQYLNNTLNIRCGLCFMCNSQIEIFQENITSSIVVELITFGTPAQIVSIVTNDIVTLQWLPPPVSSNQACLDCFIYNIQLINNNNEMNESQIIQFNTTDTEVNITRLNITKGFDTCSNYSWNVTAIHNASNSASQAAPAGNNILLQSEPNITSKVNYYLKEDNETATEELIVNFTISTLQPLDTLTYRVCVNYSDGYQDCHSQPNITVTAQNGTTVELDVPLTTANINITDLCVIVFVSNECGNDSNFLSLNCQKSLSSLISSDQTNSIFTEITSSIQFSLATMSVSHDPFPGLSPSSTVQQKNTNLSFTIIIIIPIILIVIFVIILIPILIIVVCAVCCKKKRYAISNKRRQEDVDSSTDNQINGLEYTAVTLSQTVSDYLTPTEAINAVNTYQSLQTDSAAENSENQYCEPEKLISTISRTSFTKRSTTTDWNSTELQDIAGYCVPPNQIVNNSKKATLLAATLSVEDASVPMYADINEIKARKLASTKYASLDLHGPSTPETPPPLPPHRDVTYSKIIQEDVGSYTQL